MAPRTPPRKHHRKRTSMSKATKISPRSQTTTTTEENNRVSKQKPVSRERQTSISTSRLLRSQKLSIRPAAEAASALSLLLASEDGTGRTQLVENNAGIADLPPALQDMTASEPEDHQANEDDKMLAGLRAKTEPRKDNNSQDSEHCFRRICILFDGDPQKSKMETIRAMLDTGSYHTLIFEKEMASMEINWTPFSTPKDLWSVQNRPFKAIGSRELVFTYKGKDRKHNVNAYVLEDPENKTRPSFDILLGRDHLFTSNAFTPNFEVIGDRVHNVSHYPPILWH